MVPDLHGIKLISADLGEAYLSGTQLENADLRQANLLHASR